MEKHTADLVVDSGTGFSWIRLFTLSDTINQP